MRGLNSYASLSAICECNCRSVDITWLKMVEIFNLLYRFVCRESSSRRCLSVCWFVCLPACLFVCLSICVLWSIYLFIFNVFLIHFVCECGREGGEVRNSLSLSLSVSLSLWIWVWIGVGECSFRHRLRLFLRSAACSSVTRGDYDKRQNGPRHLPNALKPKVMSLMDPSALPFARKSSLVRRFYRCLSADILIRAHA